jgi:hypothetical protein
VAGVEAGLDLACGMAEISQEVLDLCDGLDGFPVLLIMENCCDVNWYGLELRLKKNVDGTWDFDEIVGPCFLHIEQMSDWSYWLGISTEQVARTSCV